MKKSILILAIAGGMSVFACNNNRGNTGETANDTETMDDNSDIGDNMETGMDTATDNATMDTTRNDTGM